MIPCPSCGFENLEGNDFCDQCQNSLTDLSIPQQRSAVERGLVKDTIEFLKPHKPSSVSPNDTVGEVLQKMVSEKIGCVMVVEGEEIRGIFTEFDALMKVNTNAASLADKPISTVMTASPVTIEIDHKIAFALHRMHVGGYRHVPVLNKGKLVGVTSIRDILNYLAERIVVSA
ncbi:CBS domain-containing protein [Bythopirellula polymerisocia]|uniref:Inosine 5'-monophosphate dehydrogenase n=1 Tax=Bythopirellula polymerisocia TaxID=2528003 RepID=A0A5C6D0J5_9BACT|nr:CBS domain-containing protein [Bythopirellula polymerisocia]TWU29287.1 inosine 5'-monophosphate dehydrogenase [Bythopirellula polymerisocia]